MVGERSLQALVRSAGIPGLFWNISLGGRRYGERYRGAPLKLFRCTPWQDLHHHKPPDWIPGDPTWPGRTPTRTTMGGLRTTTTCWAINCWFAHGYSFRRRQFELDLTTATQDAVCGHYSTGVYMVGLRPVPPAAACRYTFVDLQDGWTHTPHTVAVNTGGRTD